MVNLLYAKRIPVCGKSVAIAGVHGNRTDGDSIGKYNVVGQYSGSGEDELAGKQLVMICL